MDNYLGDDVMLKEAHDLIERALAPNAGSYLRPMLIKRADERLQAIFYRTLNQDLKTGVSALRMALRALK